ncbi:helix-turn-helix transcriptional regulator [Escherichia coli]|uniref:helix-turn-helix domain-containing protein n=1 Tax=Enterobacteriaceae TaxID=543 RepID=UPI00033C057B|nr:MULTISPECIES: helix-turn-helix transcriptional regulator [Enterobacteriaceae]HBZ3613113.1 helix-turn-helix transcriptional regulator [Klebsiella pneumoniae]HCW3068589.1 helix-turn-helix transcriptional regulator [Citrobacter freundii]EFB1942680.1 helix-turn-helix transcriptional regulator [Escherichia coli]EIA0241848.1 helix-turn-helix transcriptional regulator [Escherichia coli]EJN1749234.1 helix-turn-helix transcriptional regulator [Escherichia coli]
MKMSQKLRAIRKAEGLTQAKFCELTGLAISTLKNYEGEHREPGIQIVTQIVNTPLFKKYTLWIMTDETAPQAGQIAPAFAHIGQESTESDHSEKQTG